MPILFCLLTICSIFIYATDDDCDSVIFSEKLQRTYSKHGSWAFTQQLNRENSENKRKSVQLEESLKKEESKGTLPKSILQSWKKLFRRSSSFNADAIKGPEIIEPLATQGSSSTESAFPWEAFDRFGIANQRPRDETHSYEIIMPAPAASEPKVENGISRQGKLTKNSPKSASFCEASMSSFRTPSPSVKMSSKPRVLKNEKTITHIKPQFFGEYYSSLDHISETWLDTLLESYRELSLCPHHIYTINSCAAELHFLNPLNISSRINKHASNLDTSNLTNYIMAFNSINKLAARMHDSEGAKNVNPELEKGFVEGFRQMRNLSDPLLLHFGNEYSNLMLNQINLWHVTGILKFTDTFARALTMQKNLSKLKSTSFDSAYSLVLAKQAAEQAKKEKKHNRENS